jgi:hypothetical protein
MASDLNLASEDILQGKKFIKSFVSYSIFLFFFFFIFLCYIYSEMATTHSQ